MISHCPDDLMNKAAILRQLAQGHAKRALLGMACFACSGKHKFNDGVTVATQEVWKTPQDASHNA